MSNTGEFYDHTTYPVTRSTASSAGMRQELDLVEAGFNKLPPMSGNAMRLVKVGSAGTDMTVTGLYEDSSNRVLIGINSSRSVGGAARQLQLESASQSSISLVRNTNDNVGSLFIGAKSRGTAVGSSTAVTSGDELMQLAASGGDGTNMTPVAAAVQFSVDGAVATGQVPGRIVLYTTPVGSSSPVERARLTAAGNLGIGMTPVQVLDVTKTQNATSALQLLNADAGNAADARLQLSNGTVQAGLVMNGTAHATLANIARLFVTGSNPLAFVTNGSERARFDGGGDLIIGGTTNTASSKLCVIAAEGEGQPASVNGDDIRLFRNSVAGAPASISVIAGTTSSAAIQLGDATAANRGALSFNNSTGALSLLQAGASRLAIDSSGNVTLPTAGAALGYGTGAGGTVTQLTSKATGVTLNRPSGQITMNGAALAAATAVSFTLTNSVIGTTDVVHACIDSAATAGAYSVTVDAVGAGTCQISLRNHTAGSLSEAVVLNFVVLRAATA